MEMAKSLVSWLPGCTVAARACGTRLLLPEDWGVGWGGEAECVSCAGGASRGRRCSEEA